MLEVESIEQLVVAIVFKRDPAIGYPSLGEGDLSGQLLDLRQCLIDVMYEDLERQYGKVSWHLGMLVQVRLRCQ